MCEFVLFWIDVRSLGGLGSKFVYVSKFFVFFVVVGF